MTNGGGEQTIVQYNLVSADYFRALGVPLVAGRHFSDDEERDGLPVVIVSKTAASRLWPGRDAVGARLRIAVDPAVLRGSALSRYADVVVVGVAEDAVSGVLAFGTSRAVAYFPTSVRAQGTRLLVQVRGEAGSVRFPLERKLDHFVPGGVEELHPMSEYLAAQVYPFQAAYWISNAVGVIALLLTISGVYGVLSFVVAQRMKEFGIRMALGATARGLIALVLRQSFLLATVGIAAGLALAIAAALLLNSAFALLLNLSDVVPYVGGAFVVLIACLVAAYVPSRRATRIDPVMTLRAD
jgi:hypothetical protein